MPEASSTRSRRLTARRRTTRSERIMRAVLDALADGHARPVSELRDAALIASTRQELHTVVHRMMERGLLQREGDGYHQGDAFRYRAAQP
jgi:hypothetical protein